MLENVIFEADEIYHPRFAQIYALVVHVISILSLLSSCFLIFVIIKKTPKYMSNLKIYLIPYSLNVMVIEVVWGVYTPMLLHPFVYFYPAGFAKNFPPNLSLIFVGCGAFSAILLLDCSVGMANERFFALRSIENSKKTNSKIPLFLFLFASLSCGGAFGCGVLVILIKPLASMLFVPVEEIPVTVQANI